MLLSQFSLHWTLIPYGFFYTFICFFSFSTTAVVVRTIPLIQTAIRLKGSKTSLILSGYFKYIFSIYLI